MIVILLIVLLLLAIGGLPTWNYSRDWRYGYYPSGFISIVLVILLVMMLMGRI